MKERNNENYTKSLAHMESIKSHKPNLHIQTGSIRAKLFVSFFHFTGSVSAVVLLIFIVSNFQIILT